MKSKINAFKCCDLNSSKLGELFEYTASLELSYLIRLLRVIYTVRV